MSGGRSRHVDIQGYASKGFEAVREAFTENFSRRNELGSACCVYHHGEKVVDLWGGIRNKATASRGKRTRWSWSSRRPRAWPP